MQELHRQEPVGSLSASLGKSLQQLAAGIGGQLQQRRQRQDNALGLIASGIPEKEAQLMSGMDPQLLAVTLKQHLMEPARQSNYEIARQMFGGGNQQQINPEQNLSSMAAGQENQSNVQQPQQSGMPRINLPEKGQMSDNDLRILQQNFAQQQNIATKKQIANEKANLTRELAAQKSIEDEKERDWKSKESLEERKLKATTQKEKTELGLSKEERKAREKWEGYIADIKQQRAMIQSEKEFQTEVRTYLDSGQPLTGIPFTILQKLGLEKAGPGLTTQAINKAVYMRNLKQLSGIKGMSRMTNRLIEQETKANPSLENTPEGLAAIMDKNEILNDVAEQIVDLKEPEYNRIGQKPLEFKYPDPDYFINDKIRKIEENGLKRIKTTALKHAGFSSQSDMVEKAPDPKSFDTRKNGELYLIDGKVQGSDGTKWREAKYDEDENGNPVKFLGFKG